MNQSTRPPASLLQVLNRRGFQSPEQVDALLNPSLSSLAPASRYPHMDLAVQRIRRAIDQNEAIGIYADRDVDGLSGLAILWRSLRALGGQTVYGSPLKGRGVEREVLDGLLKQGARVMIFVDCGGGEDGELAWLASQNIDVIVADHHRLAEEGERPKALAWIHPQVMIPPLKKGGEGGFTSSANPPQSPFFKGGSDDHPADAEAPAGCVMAFKIAQALWTSFLGDKDPERLGYFLYDHLDLLALGILADRMPLTGENRIFVWHGLRRLSRTRKAGLQSLMKFFRLAGRSKPVTVREATWQLIPMLNAAGRLGQPQVTAQLLITEDAWSARRCVDQLIDLNSQRRSEQQRSLDHFEKTVLEQCSVESDPVLVALAEGLEPSVTGLAAQSLVRKYNRPAFLFVGKGEEMVGSARGTDEVDLYAWIEAQKDILVKYGGHEGAVGLTIRRTHYAAFRERLLTLAARHLSTVPEAIVEPEASLTLAELDAVWWEHLARLEPFGPGFLCPVFEITDIEEVRPASRRSTKSFYIKSGRFELAAEFEQNPPSQFFKGGSVIGYPVPPRKADEPVKWMIQEVRHG